MKDLRRIIREEIDDLDWIRDISGDIPEVDDTNKYMALVELLGIDEVFGDVIDFDDEDTEFKQNTWTHYGIDTFTLNNGEEWAVGTEDEFNKALREYWSNFPDEIGIENVYDYEYYLTMSEYERESFANEEADNYVGDLSDEECIEREGFEESYEELNEKMEELDDEYYELEYDDDEKDLEREEEIKEEKRELQKEIDSLIEKARESARDSEFDTWYDCLSDPVHCLVYTYGFYNSAQDMVNYGLLDFDLDEFVEDMMNQSSYGDLSSYDSDYQEVGDYILIRLN